jgi:hypothetical protein
LQAGRQRDVSAAGYPIARSCKGVRKIGGDELPWAARVADVADLRELFAWTGGPEVARSILLERRGRALDP